MRKPWQVRGASFSRRKTGHPHRAFRILIRSTALVVWLFPTAGNPLRAHAACAGAERPDFFTLATAPQSWLQLEGFALPHAINHADQRCFPSAPRCVAHDGHLA